MNGNTEASTLDEFGTSQEVRIIQASADFAIAVAAALGQLHVPLASQDWSNVSCDKAMLARIATLRAEFHELKDQIDLIAAQLREAPHSNPVLEALTGLRNVVANYVDELDALRTSSKVVVVLEKFRRRR
jgi:hypothetical protein